MIIEHNKKVVVITGASKGIGRELARAFAREGARVVINYYQDQDLAKELQKEIQQKGFECIILYGDVSKEKDVENLFENVVKEYKKIDVLINNAGVMSDECALDMSLADWEKVINTNLTGTYLCCKVSGRYMMKQNMGKIINIASLKAYRYNEKQLNYAVSKAGIISLTQVIAKEFGKYGISVNVVCPGYIRSDLNKYNCEKYYKAKEASVLNIDTALLDCVNSILFLASNACNGISGQCFFLDSRIQ